MGSMTRTADAGQAGTWCLLACIAASALPGCGHPSSASAEFAPSDSVPRPVVHAVKPVRKTMRHTITQPGWIEAFQRTPIHAKIAGYVREVKADIGDVVKKNQTLAVLHIPESDEEAKIKQALVVQARTEIEQAQKTLEAAQAHVRSSEALLTRWKSEYDRLERLVRMKSGVIDQQVLDETRSQWESAQATRDESMAKRDKAEADVRVARARLVVSEAEERRQAVLLDYAQIRAPYDGVVTARNIHEGHFIQPTLSGGPGTPLFVVVQADQMRIFVDVPESDVGWIASGVPARVRIPSLQDQEFAGKVARSAWALDAKNRTLRTEIDLPNQKRILRPGMYSYVTIVAEKPDCWMLPAGVVVTRSERTFCFLLQNGKAVQTPLQLGGRDGTLVEILKLRTDKPEGEEAWRNLTGDDVLLLGDIASLADGQTVEISKDE